MIDKHTLRGELRSRLAGIPRDKIARMSERIEASVWSLPEARSARTILLYASLGSEVATDSIAREARTRGVRVIYPRCLPGEAAMTLHAVTEQEELVSGGTFGIREPAPDCPLISLEEIDLAFIPGLGWDRVGHRLGRGAGYYDRILADPGWRAVRCGLFFSFQEVREIPAEAWDQRLDVVVTEQEVVRMMLDGRR